MANDHGKVLHAADHVPERARGWLPQRDADTSPERNVERVERPGPGRVPELLRAPRHALGALPGADGVQQHEPGVNSGLVRTIHIDPQTRLRVVHEPVPGKPSRKKKRTEQIERSEKKDRRKERGSSSCVAIQFLRQPFLA